MRLRALAGPLVAVVLFTSCGGSLTAPRGNCLPPTPIAATGTVNGIAYSDDCDGPDGSLGDIYSLTLTAQTQVLITLTPSGFEGQVMMLSGNFGDIAGTKLIFDVVGNGTICAKAFLPPGNYFILAGSAENVGGDYTLTLAPTTSTPCSNVFFNYTVRGADIPGVVVIEDCPAGAPNSRQEAYGLWLAAGEAIQVSIDMNKPGDLLWRRSGNPTAPDLAGAPVFANTTLTTTFTAPDANDPFGIHVIAYPALTGNATFTLRIR